MSGELQLHPIGITIGILLGVCIVLILIWMLKPKEFGNAK